MSTNQGQVDEQAELKNAINSNDFERIKRMMTRNPALHRAPIGYGGNGPLTWVAECREPWEPPGPTRLALAKWMIENGSDVHQGGDGPLMRAALYSDRIPMMELLVSHGADPNARMNGDFPIIFSPCETVDPDAIKWLLDHGADPNCADPRPRFSGTALDYVIGSYLRSPKLGTCIDVLLAAGAVTKYPAVVLEVLRGNVDRLATFLDADPSLVNRQFPELNFGATDTRTLTLQGTTLLHVAAEYLNVGAVTLLLSRGADVNARAALTGSGTGGQTPIFHAVAQGEDDALPVVRLLVERSADLSVRVKLPGHSDQPGEVIECTPLGYAQRFQNEYASSDTARVDVIAFLRERGAIE